VCRCARVNTQSSGSVKKLAHTPDFCDVSANRSTTGHTLQRIHFTADDLAGTSLMSTVGPIAETLFALDTLVRADRAERLVTYHEWHRQVQLSFGDGAGPVESLGRLLQPVPDLLWLLDEPTRADSAALRRTGMSRRQVAAVVHEFHRLAVAPRWRRMRSYLEAEREVRGRILVTGGIGRLLAMVHPEAIWRPPVLELPLERHDEVHLGGRGLAVAPSLFLSTRACVLVGGHGRPRRPVLVFPVPPDRARARLLWEGEDEPQRGLPALVGRTRAAVLEALTETHTTGELAERLGITSAGVSQHTAVLRGAGLITTRRSRNMALHNLTALGLALLEGRAAGFRALPDSPPFNRPNRPVEQTLR
jgi:DNA-binding transcriptional ArsR family regulator